MGKNEIVDLKENIKAKLKFATEKIDKEFWNNVLWTNESEIELFGYQNR